MQVNSFPASTYINRREQLKSKLGNGLILFLGNKFSPMNYKDNYYHFRQDSCFLYYFGIDLAGLNAVIDLDDNQEIIFGDELSMDDIVWTGPLPSISEMAENVGVKNTKASSALSSYLEGKKVHFLNPYRDTHRIDLSNLLGRSISDIDNSASESLIHAIIEQRNIKEQEEIAELDKASSISSKMHRYVMASAKPGLYEYDLVAKAYEIVKGNDSSFSFPCILTKNGHILHSHDHSNLINDGDLILFDGGASAISNYAGDMTRAYPANGKFTNQQKEIYNIVLDAQMNALNALRPGYKYLDAHLLSSLTIAEGLKSLGLMKGDMASAVSEGAHALFFQHGLGHMIGLDVHDMENLGENNVGYETGQTRSQQFGLKSLRLARTLEAGHAITVEPGIYFIPALIDKWQAENKFEQFINYDALNAFRNFGGIRIEDDVIITESGHRILGEPLAKTVEEVEAVMAE